MAATPRAAKEKAQRAQAQARRASAEYRRAKSKAKREHRGAERQGRGRGRSARVWIPRAVGLVGYALVGVFPYLASALLVPPGAYLVLLALWALGLLWTIRLAKYSPAWTPVAPLVALTVWVILVQTGSELFGWSA